MNEIADNNVQSSRSKGAESESIAVEYLLSKGYKIIKRNFNFGIFLHGLALST